ncbi:hypothetical protein HQ590_12680, partial [bacterium]|nr:hypothetical protein [bacterium]
MTVFCDLDGTLLDVSIRHHAVYRSVLQQWDEAPLPRDAYWALKRRGASTEAILTRSGLAPRVADFSELFVKWIEHPRFLACDKLV